MAPTRTEQPIHIINENPAFNKLSKITEFPFPVRHDTTLTEVLPIDQNTNDNHVARDSELLRLTGAHPFNAEPPLSTLFDNGFLTPVSLHFVRNHGPVPKFEPQDKMLDWEIEISGLVEQPYKLKLSDIIQDFDIFTVPITLVCAGNRRKEQNLVKKGTGFNWGSGGISTSLWTGCMLGDAIFKARPHRNARYIWMEGADNPAKGPYGTCVRLSWALDPERSIMLAYKQNGEWLTPDHGKPLRVVIPGVIGGRSVKWLKKLVVSDTPSENWYHYFDNRVLPTMVTPEMAKSDESWWKDERYAIMDLNVQSVICKPEMNEVIPVTDENKKKDYLVQGFAYNGGGIRIGRVEVSLDKGKSWRLADINYPEDEYRNSGYFRLFGGLVNVCDRMSCLCWCFWKLKVPISELAFSKDILVRAMDERMVIQPRNMYWNVTSMLNNWWYRVSITSDESSNSLKFEHPCTANKPGGWMERVKNEGGDLLDNNWGEYDPNAESASQAKRRVPKPDEDLEMMCNPEKMSVIITKAEFAAHEDDEEHPWFVIKGHVFDGTSYLKEHPGGIQSITNVSGTDATEDFIAIHSTYAKKLMPPMHLGILEKDSSESNSTAKTDEPFVITPTLLDPRKWKKITLAEKEIISHDSRIFKFDLEHKDQLIGLPTGLHLFLRLRNPDGKLVMRAYTPKSNFRLKGRLEVLVKIYFPTKDFPAGGAFTTLLEGLKIGDQVEVKGPIGEFEYISNGSCLFNKKPYQVSHFVMIGGGTGITPVYQVIQEIFYNSSDDKTTVRLFFGNRTEEDILLKTELDNLVTKYPNQITVDNCLSDVSSLPKSWTGLTGRLNDTLLDSYIRDKKERDYMILVCGPPGMNKCVESWSKTRNIECDRVVYF